MIYQTSIPDCWNYLDRLLDFQEQLLQFCANNQSYDATELRNYLGAEVFEWLNTSPTRQRILDHLKTYIKQEEKIKVQVLEEFRQDRRFPERITDSAYHLRLMNGQFPLLKNLQRMLINFYEQLKDSGYPSHLCGCSNDHFTANDWWAGFQANNPQFLTCPMCDATLSGGKSIEHFFPKGTYFAMSVHPFNLIPCCKGCNNEVKGEKDPFNGFQITQMNIPYQHAITQDANLTFHEDYNGNDIAEFQPKSPDPTITMRIRNLEYLFRIPSRWNENIPEISSIAIKELCAQIGFYTENGEELSEDLIRRGIQRTIRRLHKDWGKFHFLFPATEWLRYAEKKKFDYLSREVTRQLSNM